MTAKTSISLHGPTRLNHSLLTSCVVLCERVSFLEVILYLEIK